MFVLVYCTRQLSFRLFGVGRANQGAGRWVRVGCGSVPWSTGTAPKPSLALPGFAKIQPSRKTSVRIMRRSGAESTLLQSCMYSRLAYAKKHIKPYALTVVRWWPLGWVSLQADAHPQKSAFIRHTLNP